jgi:hypothetical protein
MIIPRVGYDVRKGSDPADPPDVQTPTSEGEPETPYSCIDGMYEIPTIAPSGDSSRATD